MRLGDYYRGLPLRLITALPPEEVARRINDAAASPLQPLATGVLGHARDGHLALRYRPGFFAYKGMPMLTGAIVAHRGGALLDLHYRGRALTRAAFPIANAAIALMILAFLAFGQWTPAIAAWQQALLIALLILVANLPLIIHIVAIRKGEAQLGKLAEFLRTTLGASDADRQGDE